MKKLSFIIVISVMSFCLVLGLFSHALYARDSGHFGGRFHHFGGPRVFIGGYYGFPYYYNYWYYPYYNAEPYAYVEPPVYGESNQVYYWYFCKDPQGYYPYIASCPGGWVRVLPTPPKQ